MLLAWQDFLIDLERPSLNIFERAKQFLSPGNE